MPRKASLPDYAAAIAPGKIEVDAEKFYPELLAELGVADDAIDQYWLEVAFQCMKLDIQSAIAGTDLAPQPGGALAIIVRDGSKAENGGASRWAQSQHPPGKGVEAATHGREAREHYRRIRPGTVI